MSRLIRLIVGLIVVEGALAGLWWYLLQPNPATGRTSFIDPVNGPIEVGRIMGGAMGALFGLAIFLYLVASAADRRKAKQRRD